MNALTSSPYLNDSNRLADVISAIQAMSTYKFYKLSFGKWAERINADESKGDYWKRVFEEHPEFFRLDTDRANASLVWRRQYPKRYHVDMERHLDQEEYAALSDAEKRRVSRDPLTPGDIKTLIDTAINLHGRAVELQRESRWWKTTLLSAAAGVLGGLVVTMVNAFL